MIQDGEVLDEKSVELVKFYWNKIKTLGGKPEFMFAEEFGLE